VRLAAEKNK